MRDIIRDVVITLLVILASALVHAAAANAWSGYNYDTGEYFEIESYDHQGKGEGPVEYYDWATGEYKHGYLDMYPGGDGDLTDYETGETYSVDMD